jgi:two-component system chemotaxis response regulator CheY
MRKILRRVLERMGFEVTEAEHGQAALDTIEANGAPDICLVDWNMPVMDGLQFVVTLRAQREYRDVTLMMVTTESEYSQIVRALAAGAHEYLIKPFTAEAVEETLAILGMVPA